MFSFRLTFFLILSVLQAFCAPSATSEIAEKYRDGMYAIMTGTGSAFPDPERAGASVMVIVDGEILQFDFGRGVMENMMLVDINPLDLDYVFFTHHHFDHIASYDYFVFCAWIGARQNPIRVLGPPGTVQMHNGAINDMHHSDYEFVQFIVDNWPASISKKPLNEPPFSVADVSPGVIVENEEFRVTAVSTPHYPEKDKLSMAYRVDSRHGSIVISGDTGPSKALSRLARNADLLIHELVKPDPGILEGGKFADKEFQQNTNRDHDKEVSDRPQTGHTSPTELGELAAEANVGKLVAYHLAPYSSVDKALEMVALYTGPRPDPAIWTKMKEAIRKNYSGPFVLSEDRMIFDISNSLREKVGQNDW